MLDQFRRRWINPLSGQSDDISAPGFSAAIPERSTDQHSLIGLAAFVQLNHSDYLRYARARLGDETASRAAVEETVAAVSDRWDDFLRNARPAADAWRQLRGRVKAANPGADGQDPAVGRLYDTLSQNVADTALLRWRLSMDTDPIADLMGVDPPAVAASLLTVRRQIPAATLRRLGQRTPHP